MRRNVRVKAFIGNSDEIADLCNFLHNDMGLKSADIAWIGHINNEVIKVDVKEYAEAVLMGSVYLTDKGYKKVAIVSLANQRLNQVEDTALYARYKMHIKNAISEEQMEG